MKQLKDSKLFDDFKSKNNLLILVQIENLEEFEMLYNEGFTNIEEAAPYIISSQRIRYKG